MSSIPNEKVASNNNVGLILSEDVLEEDKHSNPARRLRHWKGLHLGVSKRITTQGCACHPNGCTTDGKCKLYESSCQTDEGVCVPDENICEEIIDGVAGSLTKTNPRSCVEWHIACGSVFSGLYYIDFIFASGDKAKNIKVECKGMEKTKAGKQETFMKADGQSYGTTGGGGTFYYPIQWLILKLVEENFVTYTGHPLLASI